MGLFQREGNLNVETSGGDVTLGDMRGGKAKILTNGGCFTADLVHSPCFVPLKTCHLASQMYLCILNCN